MRRNSEEKVLMNGDEDYVDNSSNNLPRQQSFFQDERTPSSDDLEYASGTAKVDNSPENIHDGHTTQLDLQPLEVTLNGTRRPIDCLWPWKRRKTYIASLCLVLFVITLALSTSVGIHERQEHATTVSNASSGDSSTSDDSSIYPPPWSPRGEAGKVTFFASPLLPLSKLDPVKELNLYPFDRPEESYPSTRLDSLNRKALPTNAWYQNILRLNGSEDPTSDHKAYLMPYLVDMAGAIPGIRIHSTRLVATPSQVTLTVDTPYALTLGAMAEGASEGGSGLAKGYTVREATELGITLHWDAYDMKSSLVRGSPFITMIYNQNSRNNSTAIDRQSSNIVPAIYSEVGLSTIAVDGSSIADINQYCGSEQSDLLDVQQELDLTFSTGQRWLIFLSRPVQLSCQSSQGSQTTLQVQSNINVEAAQNLIVQAALVMPLAGPNDDERDREDVFTKTLRANHRLFPGDLTSVHHSFNTQHGQAKYAKIYFHWDPQSLSETKGNDGEMIMFAMPHHRDLMGSAVMDHLCVTSLVGPMCLVNGTTWEMVESLPMVDFQAPRHPDPEYIPVIAQALMEDIKYQIPSNFQVGAGDTYFSGKTIAKLARILIIAEEIKELCFSKALDAEAYSEACAGIELPSETDFQGALDQLRQVVTVWIKDNDQAPFVYDTAWGGVVSCGCLYQDGVCSNKFPTCPSFTDQGLNFGNGFYNDHHFHYGYHIYAAAIVAHFDEEWGRENFENVLLLVRDYANPSSEDHSFPLFRNKDFYNGHSWANGITNPIFQNIMNQESSSEAIASYEAVALFGKAMASVFRKSGDLELASRADAVQNIGMSLAATEIRSTQKYWQVLQNVDEGRRTYPSEYAANVVGIFWSTFIQFGTWFGNSPYLIYGIQLLPLTPISEARDDVAWAQEIYAPLAASCDQGCVSSGWSVQLFAILATIGHRQKAVEQTLHLSPSVYEGAGGNGHSKSNTLWYIATRPVIDGPYPIDDVPTVEIVEITCSQPATCTREYLASMAGAYSCRARIEWLINVQDMSETAACAQVSRDEFPAECGLCFPQGPIENVNNESNRTTSTLSPSEETLTCFQPEYCTNIVLDRMAGSFSCRERIKYLMGGGNSEELACLQVAGVEFPSVCGECIPNR